MLKTFYRALLGLSIAISSFSITCILMFFYFGHDLPDHQFLKKYHPPEGSRIYTNNGDLYRELATERRMFVPIHEMPPLLVKAFLAAEDKNFYYHAGIDAFGMVRAMVMNTFLTNWRENPVGASTITQQVAKNFLVGNQRSFARKVREAIMSLRIENALDKDRILELYLNQIYLGMRSYGVGAAAYTYFQKPLHELTLGECAFLASLPKAPANYHPIREPKRALVRRNWTLKRLKEEGIISNEDLLKAQQEPLNVSEVQPLNQASYAGELVRRELIQRFGESVSYKGGLMVHTTLDPDIQKLCEQSLQQGLEIYDKRYGYRGALERFTPAEMAQNIWLKLLQQKIRSLTAFPSERKKDIAVVLNVFNDYALIGFSDGRTEKLSHSNTQWAFPVKLNGAKQLGHILHEGDVIVTRVLATECGEAINGQTLYCLDQVPAVTGGIVVMDAETGVVLGTSGGYSPEISQFNCATQAMRQPGSAFKPFVYLAALEMGYTKNSIIDDSPIEVVLGKGLGIYAPRNYTRRSLGPSPLYVGVEQSRNQMTVRLAHQIGMKHIQDIARRVGIMNAMPAQLAMSLGAGETTLFKLTAAYASIVNGGKRLYPHVIKRIHDQNGHILFQTPPAFNDHLYDVRAPYVSAVADIKPAVQTIDVRQQVIKPEYAKLMEEMLRGVVIRGTAKKIKYLRETYGLDIGGKTGTTNDYKDAWFIGFIRFPSGKTWLIGSFVGFSTPKPLGDGETGGRAAIPLFEILTKNIIKLYNING